MVGLAGETEKVWLAGSPPAEDGCVQMLSSVTEDKLSEDSNGVNMSCRFLVSVNVYLHVPNTSISCRYKRPIHVILILRYFPRASAVRFITTSTGVVPASLTSENIVLPVLVERRSALWTERFESWNTAGSSKRHLHTPNTPSLGNVQQHKGYVRVRGSATILCIHSKISTTTQ